MTDEDKLEARLKEHRESSSLVRDERAAAMELACKAGTEEVFKDFVGYHKESADTMTDIIGPGVMEEKEVKRAISFPSGILSLDYMTGPLPVGVVEIFGRESTGKSTLVFDLMQSAQSQGKLVALAPSEFLDLPYMDRIGVDVEHLLLIRGKMKYVFEICIDFLSCGEDRVLVLDSATGLRPENDEWANWRYAMFDWMKKVVPCIRPGSCLIMTNQVRTRRSVDPKKFFAGGTDSTAVKLAGMFDVRLELSRENVKDNSYDMVVNMVSHIYRRPGKFITLPVVKGEGIDIWRDVVRVASATGVLVKNGSWYSLKSGEDLGQGEENAARNLANDPVISSRVHHLALRAILGI